jgi:hypothetical protein
MRAFVPLALSLASCVRSGSVPAAFPQSADTVTIAAVARALSADSMRGRGPWTSDAARAARFLAARLERLGARPVFGQSLLVPFVAEPRLRDTV